MPRPTQITPAIVNEWRRLQRDESLDVEAAAERVGYSLRGLYKAETALGAVAGARPGAASAKRVKAKRRASAGARQAARQGATRAGRTERDPITELEETSDLLKDKLNEHVDTRGLSNLVQAHVRVTNAIESLRKGRKDTGSELAAIMAKGPQAIEKIRAGRRMLARQEVASGCCAACGGKLSDEQVAERKVRAA